MLDRTSPLTRPRALALVALAWAAIYLPALGSLEIKGEEGRRILPAVTMLQSGDWIVPRIGGEPYLSKPPLLNWLVAISFKISGAQNEWTARAPTVLAVLALGLGLAWRGGAWLGPGGGLVAALLTLTSVGLMEKGRLAELEGLYVACFGLALVDWLASWRTGSNAWRLWLGPALPLGLGLLTKGPLCVVFFYAIVGAVLWRAGRLRELRHPAQFVGLALMLGIFAAWAMPYWQQAPRGKVGSAWSAQFTGRVQADEGFRFNNWIQNVPRGLFLFVPWAVFLPLLWQRETTAALAAQSPVDAAILRGARWALAVCFLVVLLLPGGLPRYILPLLVPAALLVAQALFAGDGLAVQWRKAWLLAAVVVISFGISAFGWVGCSRLFGWRIHYHELFMPALTVLPILFFQFKLYRAERIHALSTLQLALLSTAAIAAFTWAYALATPWLRGGENLRAAAARLNVASAPDAIYALAPGYQPFLFYLRPAPRYIAAIDGLPAGASGFLLVKNDALPAATTALAARGIPWHSVVTFDEKNRGRYFLLEFGRSNEG